MTADLEIETGIEWDNKLIDRITHFYVNQDRIDYHPVNYLYEEFLKIKVKK